MKKLILLPLMLAGCANPNVKSSSSPETLQNIGPWTAVKLTDLAGQPVIFEADSNDGSASYFEIHSETHTQYLRVDNTKRQVMEVPEFKTSEPLPVETNSYAREVQKQALFAQYEDVWRCRFSQNWASVAGRDLRREGPLLLALPAFNQNRRFTVLLAIDSVHFDVLGLSGIETPRNAPGDANYYASSIEGENRLFGLASRATALSDAFGFACFEAYEGSLPSYKIGIDKYESRALNPAKENELSKVADMVARMKPLDTLSVQLGIFWAKEFDTDREVPKFDLTAIDALIQTARSGHGVGL